MSLRQLHLGSLIVTTSTGRGVPVIDFLSLDEKAITMDKIFAFFKSKNPRWKEVKSFVIDKDFVEWRVIETCFPIAKVLLCQYHAITSWRKLLARRSKANNSSGPPFNLTVVQRDDLESMFARMLNRYEFETFAILVSLQSLTFVSFCIVIPRPHLTSATKHSETTVTRMHLV
eukprot:jgi/Phyca11/132954/e_gw1.276.4.1